MKRILLAMSGGAVLVPLAILAFQLWHEPAMGESNPRPAATVERVAKGEYLARAGNCMACHTTRGGSAYAGGRAIATPFGTIHSPNITPDTGTGIGAWTADDFWRALHNGKSKDGSFLYPAFPYPNYTKVTRDDSDAIYLYLRTLPPVRQINAAHDLRFPFNQRYLLAFWRALYFTPGEFVADTKQGKDWNRGAYLVQGLGHCAACHTSRTVLGGTSKTGELAGATIAMLNWHASSLSADEDGGLWGWQRQDIRELLQTGVSQRGAVSGPMAEVVSASLQHLAQEDIDAMALYLQSVPRRPAARPAPQVGRIDEGVLKNGARIYEQHCVACHQADGKGAPPAYPPLAGNQALTARSALNPIRIVLNGGYPPVTHGNPRPYGMPPFGWALNDGEIAAVLSYVRHSWGNRASMVSAAEVAKYRGAPLD